ncbi:MAG: RNA 2'-phosphotransferase [Sporichthyaceae bacterium]
MSPDRLSRLVSHALRHEPWLYELELDEQGWVPVEALLAAVHEQGPEWQQVGPEDLSGMIAASSKRRHEMDDGRIRAIYGHSVPGRVRLSPGQPPPTLFHGTSPEAWAVIRCEGLRPMGRQYVHLSVDVATAEQVGRRKSAQPVLLTVDTVRATAVGARFWRGNELVWLTDRIGAEHLGVRE